MPSRPVRAPAYTTALPGPAAAAPNTREDGTSPTHATLTKGLAR
jgi:hypothetical protein